MPLVNISLRRGTTPEFRRALADGVHDAMVDALNIPHDDRFELIHEFAPENMLHDPVFYGIERGTGSVFVQIVLNVRPAEQKHRLYGLIADNLVRRPGVRRQDIFIGIVEVAPENWWAYARAADSVSTAPPAL